MNFKRVIKWIGYIIGVLILIYILILGVLIYFLASGDFKNSLIYLSDLKESGLYYGNENRKIADNVVAVHEVDNKLYYITLDGIGIFDENVSLLDAWKKDLNKYNTFIPRIDAKKTDFNVSLDELYPNISSLDESDRDIWHEIFYDSEKRYTGPHAGYTIKLPFYVSYRKEDMVKHNDIVDLSTGTIIGEYGSEHILRNNAYYNFEFGKLTKLDFSQKAIYSYYSDNLNIGRFSKNNSGDEGYESYERNELNKVRTKDLTVLPNLINQRFIVFNSFNEFSEFDKDTFEALAINAIKNRKALQLGPLENQTLMQYLSK
ncbi:hypothetical protein [uncultured Veillonella sp.]|uniref:hypothetical protein n=1 Tax=uncultured Veillonella sp. TaxID=159268 RepID=UPI00261BC025|nr:hypothetical protein [uncultured Veillonella sp.]